MKEITDDEFEVVLTSGRVLVEFFATWCPPCKAMKPTLAKLDKELPHVTIVQINIDDHMRYADRYGVTCLPALILFENGLEVKRHLGAMSEATLRAWLAV